MDWLAHEKDFNFQNVNLSKNTHFLFCIRGAMSKFILVRMFYTKGGGITPKILGDFYEC